MPGVTSLLDIECFQGFVVEPVRVTFALHGDFDDPDCNDLLGRRGNAGSLERSAAVVERKTHRQDSGVVKVTVYTDNHLP